MLSLFSPPSSQVNGAASETERPILPLWTTFLGNVNATASLAVPAFLFSVNNYLKFIVHLHFDPTTVKLFANLKILVIACFLRVFLKRQYSTLQVTVKLVFSNCLHPPLPLIVIVIKIS